MCVLCNLIAANSMKNEEFLEKHIFVDLKKINLKADSKAVYHFSESDFATSIKLVVDKKIDESLSEEQIYEFLREKYGDWVIYDPKLNKNTYILWLLPLLLFFLGGAIIIKKTIFKN